MDTKIEILRTVYNNNGRIAEQNVRAYGMEYHLQALKLVQDGLLVSTINTFGQTIFVVPDDKKIEVLEQIK